MCLVMYLVMQLQKQFQEVGPQRRSAVTAGPGCGSCGGGGRGGGSSGGSDGGGGGGSGGGRYLLVCTRYVINVFSQLVDPSGINKIIVVYVAYF